MNKELEKAGRVADFLELGELFAKDALERNESCGGHFREEYATPEGEAKRNDKDYTYVAAWEYKGEPADAVLHKEELNFENIEVKEKDHTNNKYTMNLKLKIWRQKDANDKGSMVDYDIQRMFLNTCHF